MALGLKIPTKTLADNFDLQDFKDDFNALDNKATLTDEEITQLRSVLATWETFKANGGEIGGTINLPFANLSEGGDGEFSIYSTKGKSLLLGTSNGTYSTELLLTTLFNNRPTLMPKTTSGVELGHPNNAFKDAWLSGYSRTPTGYTKLPNGMILQWGVYTVALPLVDTSYHDIFLPVTHVSGTLNADITIHCKGVNNIPIPIALNLYQVLNNKLQIRMRAFESTGISELKVYWKTIGY